MSFNDVIGHEIPKKIIRSAIIKKEISHAYLFYGEDGIGKRLTAFNFAKAINCEIGDGDSCDTCGSCRRMDKSSSQNFTIIKAEGSFIKISQIRAIQEEVSSISFSDEKRVFVLEDVDNMNKEASNSFLKTLEEPPEGTILILITAKLNRLLPTIVSRCQKIRFNNLTKEEILEIMNRKKEIDHDLDRILPVLSKGSVGNLLNTDIDLFLKEKERRLSVFSSDFLKNITNIFKYAEEFSKDIETTKKTLTILYIFLRDILVFIETGNDDLLINNDRSKEIKSLSKFFNSSIIIKLLKYIDRISLSLTRNINRELVIGELLLRIRESKIES